MMHEMHQGPRVIIDMGPIDQTAYMLLGGGKCIEKALEECICPISEFLPECRLDWKEHWACDICKTSLYTELRPILHQVYTYN